MFRVVEGMTLEKEEGQISFVDTQKKPEMMFVIGAKEEFQRNSVCYNSILE
ncbi:hypothetical protein [Parapedobacter tibetensis]|uniref:hypothetical protein n=1 Tax=Parapedobacter tibetensis TaxID=2972951 RepID=UPI00214D8033|nr:hypothetical protein [Parapedobacter tibetensis]